VEGGGSVDVGEFTVGYVKIWIVFLAFHLKAIHISPYLKLSLRTVLATTDIAGELRGCAEMFMVIFKQVYHFEYR
jgi:hypothetical protein